MLFTAVDRPIFARRACYKYTERVLMLPLSPFFLQTSGLRLSKRDRRKNMVQEIRKYADMLQVSV